jgi:hypothetical protein
MSDGEMTLHEWEALLREASEVDQMGVSSLYEDDEQRYEPEDASGPVTPEAWADEGFIEDDFADDEPVTTLGELL